MKNKKAVGMKIIAPIVILAVVIVFAWFAFGGSLQAIIGECTTAAPVFGTVQCSPSGSYTSAGWRAFSSSENTLLKPGDYGTLNDWKVHFRIGADSDSQRRRICYNDCDRADGMSCGTYICKQYNGRGDPASLDFWVTLKNTQSIYVWHETQNSYTGSWEVSGRGGTSVQKGYEVQYQPYVLFISDTLQGGLNKVPGSSTCVIDSSTWSKRVTSDSTRVAKIGNNPSLQPNEFVNYVSNFVLVPNAGERVTYNGQQVYCVFTGGGAKLYAQEKVVTGETCYNFPDFNDVVANVICCPGTSVGTQVCGDNFDWIPVEEAQCSYFRPCPQAVEQPDYSDSTRTTLVKQTCVDGTCVQTSRKVECTTDGACPDGYVCTAWKCVATGGGVAPPPRLDPYTCEELVERNYPLTGFAKYNPITHIQRWWEFRKCDLDRGMKMSWTTLLIGGMLAMFAFVAGVVASEKTKSLKKYALPFGAVLAAITFASVFLSLVAAVFIVAILALGAYMTTRK